MKLFNLAQFLLVAAVFIPSERLFAFHAGQKILRKGWKTDIAYTFINRPLIKVGAAALIVAISWCFQFIIPASVSSIVSSQPMWLQFIEAVIVADLGFYFAHRMFHSVPYLWKIHQVHHSIEELDWLAAARVHPIDQILTTAAMLLPLLALGFSTSVLVAHAVFYFWHSHLLHSNLSLRLGPLNNLIASPAFHHWHHADETAAYDKNYAGQLSIIDKLFGTHYMPQGRKPIKYGMGKPLPPNYLSHLMYPFKH